MIFACMENGKFSIYLLRIFKKCLSHESHTLMCMYNKKVFPLTASDYYCLTMKRRKEYSKKMHCFLKLFMLYMLCIHNTIVEKLYQRYISLWWVSPYSFQQTKMQQVNVNKYSFTASSSMTSNVNKIGKNRNFFFLKFVIRIKWSKESITVVFLVSAKILIYAIFFHFHSAYEKFKLKTEEIHNQKEWENKTGTNISKDW